jgi:hypothetical protein
MFEFTKKFEVNDKLSFRLYPELAAESYTLLVKKVKDNLVAAVISNNDKNSVDLKVSDEIFLFSDSDGAQWVTKTLLMQRHSYPLVVLSVAEEPWAITSRHEEKSLSPHGDLESTEYAGAPVAGIEDEAGPIAVKPDDNDDLASMPSITVRELNAEPERTSGQEAMRLGVEDLDSLPDIDTSELEAELNADIEDTLEKGRISFTPSSGIEDEQAMEEPLAVAAPVGPEEEDDLADMTIVKGGSLPIGNFYEEGTAEPVENREPVEERWAGPEILEVDIGEPETEPETEPEIHVDEESLYILEAEKDYPAESEAFHDFFTAYLTSAGDGAAAAIGLDADVPPEVIRAIGALTERVQRLEGALSSISGRPPTAPITAASKRIAVVLAGLTEDGFKAAMDEAPMSGERFIVEIDRQWKPPLFLRAGAVAESAFNVNDITLARFRFDGLDEAGRMAVRAYLNGRAGYFKSLTDMVKD